MATQTASGSPPIDQPARILIVDDDPHSRQLLEVMLHHEGFDLEMASSGAEALASVARQAPDLILLDVTMPDMDGYQVASRIKGNLSIHAIPIILITALDSRNARMLGLGAGADDFLSKPVERAELCVRVRNQLRLTYGDYHDQPRPPLAAKSEAKREAPDAKPDPRPVPRLERRAPVDPAGIGMEAARLIGQLSLPWQKALLQIVREVHGQALGEGPAA